MQKSMILVVAVAVALLSACTKTDKELLVGTWGIQNIKNNGEMMNSTVAKDQKAMVEKAWKEQGQLLVQMGMTKDMLLKKVADEGKQLAKVTFIFSEDGKLKISANDGGKTPDENARYTVDEKKKEFVILPEKGAKVTYKYKVSDEEMEWKMKSTEIKLSRKK